jgi:predicted ribosome-associated RNA-binding protein Tma20
VWCTRAQPCTAGAHPGQAAGARAGPPPAPPPADPRRAARRPAAAAISEQYPWLDENGVLDVLIPKKEPMFVAKWCVGARRGGRRRRCCLPAPPPAATACTRPRRPPTPPPVPPRARPASPNYMQVAIVHNTPLFFSEREGRWFPTMRILHQYPDMMPKLRCDQGAIKFVLSGANIMCPGLTSPGATIHDEVRRPGGGCGRCRRGASGALHWPHLRSRATCSPLQPLHLAAPCQVPEGAAVAIYAEGKEHAMAVGLTKLSTADIRSVNKGIAVELMHHLNDGLWKTHSVA